MATSSDKARLKSAITATDAQIQAFIKGLRRFASKELRRAIDEASAGRVKPLEVINTLAQLETVLDRAGLGDELKQIRSLYATQLEQVMTEFKLKGEPSILSAADRPIVEQIITFDTSKVANRLSVYVDDVRSTLARAILIGETPDFDGVDDKYGAALEGSLETEMNTMLQGFNRAVTVSKAQELGFELYEYLGPDDGITRDFCADLLSKDPPIYTLDEIQAMDNDQGLDVITYGGGYNCRHQWRPISNEDAQAAGYEVDDGE